MIVAICVKKKCDCKQCVTLPLEKNLELTDLGVATTDEVADSDSNIISYISQLQILMMHFWTLI
jgi:hypothetical protein